MASRRLVEGELAREDFRRLQPGQRLLFVYARPEELACAARRSGMEILSTPWGRRPRLRRTPWFGLFLTFAGALLFASTSLGQAPPPAQPAAKPAAPPAAKAGNKKAAPSAPLFAPNGEPY